MARGGRAIRQSGQYARQTPYGPALRSAVAAAAGGYPEPQLRHRRPAGLRASSQRRATTSRRPRARAPLRLSRTPGASSMPGFDRYRRRRTAPHGAAPAQPPAQWGAAGPARLRSRQLHAGRRAGLSRRRAGACRRSRQPAPMPQIRARRTQQGYGETDADYDDGLAEDEEEPRSGRRWHDDRRGAGRGDRPRRRAGLHLQDASFTSAPAARRWSRTSSRRTRSSRSSPAARRSPRSTRSCSTVWARSGIAVPRRQRAGSRRTAAATRRRIGGAAPGADHSDHAGRRPGPGPGQVTRPAAPTRAHVRRPPMVTVPGVMLETGGRAAAPRAAQPPQQQPQRQAAQQRQPGRAGRVAALPQQQVRSSRDRARAAAKAAESAPTTPTTRSDAATPAAPRRPCRRPRKRPASARLRPRRPGVERLRRRAVVEEVAHGRAEGLRRPAAEVRRRAGVAARPTCRRPTSATRASGTAPWSARRGSYEGAKKICEQLKTAGLTDCWPAQILTAERAAAECGVRAEARRRRRLCARGTKASRMLSAFITGLAGRA